MSRQVYSFYYYRAAAEVAQATSADKVSVIEKGKPARFVFFYYRAVAEVAPAPSADKANIRKVSKLSGLLSFF